MFLFLFFPPTRRHHHDNKMRKNVRNLRRMFTEDSRSLFSACRWYKLAWSMPYLQYLSSSLELQVLRTKLETLLQGRLLSVSDKRKFFFQKVFKIKIPLPTEFTARNALAVVRRSIPMSWWWEFKTATSIMFNASSAAIAINLCRRENSLPSVAVNWYVDSTLRRNRTWHRTSTTISLSKNTCVREMEDVAPNDHEPFSRLHNVVNLKHPSICHQSLAEKSEKHLQRTQVWRSEWCRCGFKINERRWRKFKESQKTVRREATRRKTIKLSKSHRAAITSLMEGSVNHSTQICHSHPKVSKKISMKTF